jgi:phosphatidylglycerophosphate synthase
MFAYLNFIHVRTYIKSGFQNWGHDFFKHNILWLKPNHLSLLNFIFSCLAGLFIYLYPNNPILAIFFLLIAYFADLYDGIIARARYIATLKGSFYDGFADRMGEIGLWTGIYFSLVVNQELVIGVAVLSLLIHYLKLHYLNIGGKSTPVIFEKAERNIFYLAFLAMISILNLFLINILWIAIIILLLLGVIQILLRVQDLPQLSVPSEPQEDTYEGDFTYTREEWISAT